MRSVEEILGGEALARFCAKGPVTHGLPPAAYTDPEFFALEAKRVFCKRWVFAGFAHELAEAGDARPLNLGGTAVVLLRNRKGDVRAFHNVCRHRGLLLVEKAGNVGPMLRCPYHAWSYDLDGGLRTTPYFSGPDKAAPTAFDRADFGLLPVTCRVWHDWIFVKLEGDAEDFDDFLRPLARQLEGLDLSAARPVATVELGEVAANWKLLMENFIEPYHVQFVHKATTEQPLRKHFTIIEGGCLGSGIDIDEREGQCKAGGSARLDVSSRYLTLFPNFVIGRYFPDQLGVHLNLPLAPDRTSQRRVIYWSGENLPTAEARKQLHDLWFAVHKEDHAVVERLQKGRHSPAAADGGLLSPHWEDSLRSFQEMLLRAVTVPGA